MLYDRTKSRFDRKFPALAPVFAGAQLSGAHCATHDRLVMTTLPRFPFAGLVARTVTVCFTAPLELMRTYVQSHGTSAHTQKGAARLPDSVLRSALLAHQTVCIVLFEQASRVSWWSW
jgi:hypothetical protein